MPPAVEPDVVNGVTTYLIVLAGVIALGVALSLTGHVTGAWFSLGLAAAVFAVVLVVATTLPEVFLGWAHFLATVVFFALIAADAILNAFWRTSSEPPPRWLRIVYIVIAVILIVDLIALVAATFVEWDAVDDVFPWILIGEAVALVAFLVFWWLQTWQRWNEIDPASLAPVERPPASVGRTLVSVLSRPSHYPRPGARGVRVRQPGRVA